MLKEVFSQLKKILPKEAEEFVADQEILAVFLNSPKRKQLMKKAGMRGMDKINKVVEQYAVLKIMAERKQKPKKREEVIRIEDECLSKVFVGRTIRLKKAPSKLSVVSNLLKQQYPNAAILTRKNMEAVAKTAGITKKPTEFVVFDADSKKIVGVNVIG